MNQAKFEALRAQFPYLEYKGFTTTADHTCISVTYEFDLSGKHLFRPGFSIPNRRYFKNYPDNETLNSENFRNLLFHIGMIELISYWKAACPPTVRVTAGRIGEKQVNWWKNVYYQGLGEFFYTNGIQTSKEEFLQIESQGLPFVKTNFSLDETNLVPVGGGKDSVVTLELLRQTSKIRPFILNPRGATLECVRVAGFGNDNFIEVNRRLDPLLLQLNSEGYLNGHTPFSALLAFYCLLVAAVSGCRNIALSNEASANEPTVAGSEINHQYSKSFAFETDFRAYVQQYISEELNYFSFLRPLSELQIARIFAEQVKYYPVFKSCNAGSKTDSWCCNCAKCLFAYIILCPFIPTIEMVNIFGKNLLELPEMIPYLKELTGMVDVKPFECVGTTAEVNMALHMFAWQNRHQRLPLLLDYYSNTPLNGQFSRPDIEKALVTVNSEHHLDESLLKLILEKL